MPLALQILFAASPYLLPPLVAGCSYLVVQALSKLPAKQRPLVESVVRSSVSAVEQMASEQLNSAGKKQLAVEMVEKQLGHMGISVPDAVVNALIEEAVLALNVAKQGTSASVVPLPLPPNK